jgi:hypothetical protein
MIDILEVHLSGDAEVFVLRYPVVSYLNGAAEHAEVTTKRNKVYFKEH